MILGLAGRALCRSLSRFFTASVMLPHNGIVVALPITPVDFIQQGKKGTQKEIAKALGISREWVEKYNPIPHPRESKNDTPYHFYGYNVRGFKDESWQDKKLILGLATTYSAPSPEK